VLHGPEDALKRQYLHQLRAANEAARGETELLTYDGATVELAQVLDELRSYGLMQQHKIVVVDAADEFLTRHREPMERYARNPVDTATLVLRSDRWNAGKLDKLIEKVGCIVKCAELKPPEAVNWLLARARDEHRCTIDRKTADLLVQRLGGDLMLLDSELAKLSLVVEKGKPITVQLVDQLVGRASEETAWAVQEALLEALSAPAHQGQAAVAHVLGKVHDLLNVARQPKELLAYFIADAVRKLHVGLLMKRQGAAAGEIAKAMKLWGGRQQLFFAALDRFDERTLGRLLDQAVAVCHRSRTGLGDGVRHIECFCASLADARR
jgi:DNA polymerase III subunit delta